MFLDSLEVTYLEISYPGLNVGLAIGLTGEAGT